jgi:hypothetical protein
MRIRLWPLCRRLFRQRDRAYGWIVKEKTRNGASCLVSRMRPCALRIGMIKIEL